MRLVFSLALFFLSASWAVTYNRILQVGPGQTFTTIGAAVRACATNDRCEIRVAPGIYQEQVVVERKNDMWIHGDENNPPTLRFLDTLSTHVQDSTNGLGLDSWSRYAERNGVIQVVDSDSIRISHLLIDGVRKFSFQWLNVWGSQFQFNGNSGIAITNSRATHVHNTSITNTWYGIRFKDRNLGGVYANLEQWEIDRRIAEATPLSRFGRYGDHLFERNRIFGNVWAFHSEQSWDLPSTIRYNLVWSNRSQATDFNCARPTICGAPQLVDGDRRYHAGGFLFLKDAILVSHNIHNNTFHDNPHLISGYFKAGKGHSFYNNIVSQNTVDSTDITSVDGRTKFLFAGYSNAHHNVLSANRTGQFPLFGAQDTLWVARRTTTNGASPVDSFVAPAGRDNHYFQTIAFQSTNPTSPFFLCPDWSDAGVERTIAGKGWANIPGPLGIPIDRGALTQAGTGCSWGGSGDSIGLRLQAASPIIFQNQVDASFRFRIIPVNTEAGAFTNIQYHYTAYIDSLPFETGVSSSRGLMTPLVSPVPGLFGALRMGTNDVSFPFPRTNLGEYGLIQLMVSATHTNGRTYVSNLEVLEYRRLNYILEVRLYARSDINFSRPLDTITKGDTVVARSRIMDLNLQYASTVRVSRARSWLLSNSARSVVAPYDTSFVGVGSERFVITSYTGGDEIYSVGGYVWDGNKNYFTSGHTLFYLRPSNASQVQILGGTVLPKGDTVTIQVRVNDVFGDSTSDPVSIRLSSSNPNQAQVLSPTQVNSNGTVSFRVVALGEIGTTFNLTATLLTNNATDTRTYSIVAPQGRVMIINKPPAGTIFATGTPLPINFRFQSNTGLVLPVQQFFGITAVRIGGGAVAPIYFYRDSASAVAGLASARVPNPGSHFTGINDGLAILWMVVSDGNPGGSYILRTTPATAGATTIWDSVSIEVHPPTLVFTSANGVVLTSLPPIDTLTGVLVPVHLEARLGSNRCNVCNDSVVIQAASQIGLKRNDGEPDAPGIRLQEGRATFMVYGRRQILDTSFTMSMRSGAVTATYRPVNFRRPPVPQADSALVFDRNGDGIGDSLVIFYEMNIRDSLPDSLVYSFPSRGDTIRTIPLASHVHPVDNSVIIITGNLTREILTQGIGNLLSWYTDADGNRWPQRLDIQDRMGPVIKSARLVENYINPTDSLYVIFSEPLSITALQTGFPFVVNANGANLPIANGTQINDTTWIFTLPRGSVQRDNQLSLNHLGPILDRGRIGPSVENRGVTVGLIRRPIPPSSNGNLFLDRNGDGTMDAVVVEFLGAVDNDYLRNELDSIVFVWIDSAGNPVQISVPGSDFTIDSENPRRIRYNIANTSSLFPFLTGIQRDRFSTSYGTATMYTDLDSNPMTVPMRDGMPPIIREALLSVAKLNVDADILHITFSEPVDARTMLLPLFQILPRGETQPRTLEYSELQWQDSSTVRLYYRSEIPMARRPSSQDSIRIQAGALADGAGNRVPEDAVFRAQHPNGENRPYRMVIGDFRFRLITQMRHSFNLHDPQLQEAPVMQLEFLPYNDPATISRPLGVAMDLGSIDLKHSVQRTLKENRYADNETILVEDIEVDLSKIQVRMDLTIFTNLSGYVAKHSERVTCDDYRFHVAPTQGITGNCIENPQQVFLRWNYKSADGRWAGTGAYVAKYLALVEYDGLVIYKNESIKTWGLMRNQW